MKPPRPTLSKLKHHRKTDSIASLRSCSSQDVLKEKLSGIGPAERKKLQIGKSVKCFDKVEAKARFDMDTKKITKKHWNVLNRDLIPPKKVYLVVSGMKAIKSQQVLPELPYILASSQPASLENTTEKPTPIS